MNKHHQIPFDVYIGRGSPWGNPYPVSESNREDSIRRYELYLREQPKLLERLPELYGQSLGCFCAPAACHGDILAAFAEVEALPECSVADSLFGGPARLKLDFG